MPKFQKTKRGLLAGTLVALLALCPCPAEFALPANGPLPFRRDRLPLDTDRMAELSLVLTNLARTQHAPTAADRRTLAQTLALALALDPANAAARQLLKDCHQGSHTPGDDLGKRAAWIGKIRALQPWLESPVAGGDAHALAACLHDVTAPAGDAAQERGAWSGWVPGVAAYEPRPAAPAVTTREDLPPPDPLEKPTHGPALTTATLPVWIWDNRAKQPAKEGLPVSSVLHMAATQAAKPDAPPTVRFFPKEMTGGDAAHMLSNLLLAHHGEASRGILIRLIWRDVSAPEDAAIQERKPLDHTAAAAVLASAAITGRVPDAIVLGAVNAEGAFREPVGLWDQLIALPPGEGKRLVLPARAASLLPSLLAIGKPGFFMDYEVLLARDFAELLDLSAGQPPAEVAAASAKFRAIRERMGASDVRSYVANPFVRAKLAELAREAPRHASAAVLQIQASGQRPTLITRTGLHAEVWRACAALAWIPLTRERELDDAEQDLIGKSLETYRKRIEEIESLAAKTDLDLIASSREIMQPLRDMERALRTRGEYDERMALLWKARELFCEKHERLTKHLATLAEALTRP